MATINVNAGVTSTGLTLTGDIMQVYGTAENTKVKTDGQLNVFNGGSANNTTVSAGGAFTVSNGGVATITTVKQDGAMTVVLGGNATSTTVSTGGVATIAGNATSTTLSGGTLYISNGGTATIATVKNGGTMHVSNGAQAISATVTSGGLTIFAGGAATSTTVKSNGEMTVAQNATATGTTATDGGTVKVQGQVTGTVLSGSENNAYLHVSDGGQAMLTTVDYNGYLYVSNGGQATSTTVKEDGRMYVSDGGKVTSTTVNHNGFLFVSNGGSVNDTVVSGGLYVSNGGSVNGVDVKTGGCLYLYTGGKATGKLTFADGATVEAQAGAIIDFDISGLSPENAVLVNNLSLVTGSPSFTLTVDDSQAAGNYKLAAGLASFDKTITVVNTSGTEIGTISVAEGEKTLGGRDYTLTLTDGSLGITLGAAALIPDLTGDLTSEYHLTAGKYASSVNVKNGGDLYIKNGGIATQTTVNANGGVNVSSGGTATNTTVNSSGYMTVSSGGVATNTTLNNGGWLLVRSGAMAGDTIVNAGCTAFIYDSGMANAVTVNKDGRLGILSGGRANAVTVAEDGILEIREGGTANGVTVETGSWLIVSSGGKVTGKVTFETGVKTNYVAAGAILDFDLTQTTPGAGVLVKNISPILSRPFHYTLTVDGTEAAGSYKLADGATSFNETITVKNISGTELGTITLDGGTKMLGGKGYTLTLTDGLLSVTVGTAADDTTPPTITNITLSTTEPAPSVTVTATFDDNVGVATKQYKIGKGDWQDYTDAGVTVTNNKTVYFRATDAVGNVATESVTVTNIVGGEPDLTGDLAATVTLTADMVGSDVNILNGGRLYVEEDGLTDKTTVNSGGKLIISSGGTATQVKENGGYVNANPYASVTYVSNSFTGLVLDNYGTATVHSGTTATDTVINGGGELRVHRGGLANNTVVKASDDDPGVLIMDTDGTLNGVTVESCGELLLYGGKLTGKITIENGAYFGVADFDFGQTLDFDLTQTAPGADVLVNSLSFHKSTSYLSYTLTVDGTEADGNYKLAEGAAGFDKTITVVNTSGTEIGTISVAEGEKTLGGRDYTLTLTDGSLGITLGAAALIPDLTGDLTSSYNLETGKVASSVNIIDPDGRLKVENGARAIQTTINSHGSMTVSAGGSADLTTVNSHGWLEIQNGATVTNVKENGGYVADYLATGVTYVPNSFGGMVFDGGDWVSLHSGTTATNLTIGKATIYIVGGKADGITVKADGQLIAYSGKLTGKITFETGAEIYGYDDTPLDFDLTATTPGADALVNNLSFVMDKNFTYTLTLGTSQKLGTYKLAEGADGFDKTITVMVNDFNLGTITVAEGRKTLYAMDYTLTLSDGVLSVTLDDVATDTMKPTVSNVAADITGPTNGNVTVTADFSDDVALKSSLYKINDGAWQDYTGGVALDENATVSFKAVDAAGNESDVVIIVIGNIDKVAPTITGITPSTTAPADSVTVTANFADNVELASQLYRIGAGDWEDYTGGVTLTENATVYFKAVDTAGNEATAQYDVANIGIVEADTTPPEKPVPDASSKAPTNSYVIVTATFSDDSVIRECSKDGVNWVEYQSSGLTFVENGTAYFRGTDAAGNESDIAVYEVTNIDRIAPEKPVAAANITTPTNGSVTVTATFSDDTVLKEYSLNGIDWGAYPGGIKLDDNGTVYFRGTDAVGNVSEVTSYAVMNIDKVAPVKPTASADVTEPTGGTVTVTAVFSEDSAVKEFSTDGLMWEAYTGPIAFSENGKVYFRASDAAGNVSEIGGYEVTNIHAVEPDNKPDNGWNDYLYDKKKGWNTEANIDNFAANVITGNGEIHLDLPGSIDFEGMHNMFGNDGTNMDTGDVGSISVTTPAKLSFSVKSSADGTFYIYEDGLDKKGNRKQITVGKVTVRNGKAATLSGICLTTGGKYYAAMTAKNVKKAGTQGVYNVTVVDSTIFRDADDGWNNASTNKAVVENPFYLERGVKTVKLDNTAMIDSGDYNNFVGFSDEVDYAKLNLASTAYLSFDLVANGNAKFTLWKRNTGTGKLAKVGSPVTLKSKNGVQVIKSTKAQLLEVSDKYEYFVSMESTDAAKGGSAYYNVNVNTVETRFFDSADGGENNWLFNKKTKEFNDDANLRTNTISAADDNVVILDNNEIGDNAFQNFVGYQDSVDYAKIVLTQNGSLTFKITALADVTFEIWQKGTDKKGKNVLNSLQKKTSLKVKDNAVGAFVSTDALTLEAGEYYVSVTAKSTKANAKGSAFYNVTAMFSPSGSASDALAMPETSDTLGISDALSFGGYDTDALASASASALADPDDKSAWQSLLA